MTWRAFIIGLIAVVGIALLDPYTSFNKGYGWNTQSHFPAGAGFVLVVVTVGLNAAIKLLRRRAALTHSELMLVWCMLIVGCAVPSNLMRFWPPVMAAPAYLARRQDIAWQETALQAAPAALLMTKDPQVRGGQAVLRGMAREGGPRAVDAVAGAHEPVGRADGVLLPGHLLPVRHPEAAVG